MNPFLGSARKPCLPGAEGGAKNAVEDGRMVLLVDPTSQSEIRQAIAALLDDPERAAAMGEAGWKRVRECFQKEMLLSRIAQVITHDCSTESISE